MGKITSMHFAGWKMGLKTGMYYLRTMAASAPIQFTVDQEKLLVADTNVARDRAPKKRTSMGFHSSMSAVPRPMYAQKNSSHSNVTAAAPNGIPTPTATPPIDASRQLTAQMGRTKLSDDGESSAEASPKVLPTDPTGPPEEDSLDDKKDQVEDGKTNEEREADIYSQKVLACSIENRDACVMCSG